MQRLLQDLREQFANHILHQGHDLFFVDERHLDIELGEFGLPVGAQVFIAETAHDLIIAIHAGDHQDLLEQLRRLRQGEEFAGMGAARHQIIPRAFGRGLGQDRGFDIQETAFIEKAAQHARGLGAHHQAPLHGRPAEIQITITQADFLAELGVVLDLERQRLGTIQDFQALAIDLHLSGGQVGIFRPRRTASYPSLDLEDEFAAHPFRIGEILRLVGIENDLDQALTITQIDEDDPAMVAAAMHPAADLHILIH